MARRRRRRRRKGLFKAIIYLSMGGVILYGATLLYGYLLHSPYLQVREIVITGGRHVDVYDMVDEAGIRTGQSILSIDLEGVRERMESFPWVKEVYVRRSFPDILRIEVVERKPLAFIYLDGKVYIMDRDGEVFKEATAGDGLDLPVITGVSRDEWGRGLFEKVREVLTLLKAGRGVSIDDVSEVRVEGMDIMLVTRDGKEIFLGREDFMERMERLDELTAFLGTGYQGVEFIDLDYDDRAVVRYRNLSERG